MVSDCDDIAADEIEPWESKSKSATPALAQAVRRFSLASLPLRGDSKVWDPRAAFPLTLVKDARPTEPKIRTSAFD